MHERRSRLLNCKSFLFARLFNYTESKSAGRECWLEIYSWYSPMLSPDTAILSHAAPHRSVHHMAARSCATIHSLIDPAGPHGGKGVAQRLTELGFFPGEAVTVLRRGPGGREPIAVQIGDTLFALRGLEAACIRVIDETAVGRP